MVSSKRGSDEDETRPGKRRLDVGSDTDATFSETESEYEERRSSMRRHRKNRTGIGRRLVKRRRAGRSEMTPKKQVLRSAITPSSSSPPEDSSGLEGEVSEEGNGYLQSTGSSSSALLKWKDIPYPGLPQIGYAFSYASGPIHFMKVSTSASRSLGAHWQPLQNYVAYVIYSLHRSPDMDNKLQGLEMVNELAGHGFVEDDDCDVREEMVQGMRALGFQKGNVVVSVPKLGNAAAFRGYWPGSKVDAKDRKMISDKLQSVMHGRALLAQTSMLTASPSPTQGSDISRLRGTTLTASEHEEEVSGSSGKDASLEDSGLIKFVKVHWRQRKWIIDNVHLIRPTLHSQPRTSIGSDITENGEENFKAVIVWSKKSDKKEGIDLLERMIAERLGGRKQTSTKDVVMCKETTDQEAWSVLHKNEVVVGFPGEEGVNEFLESVQAREQVWR